MADAVEPSPAAAAAAGALGELRVESPWSPLRFPVFRWIWLATLVSNIGTWMQTVGAQWLLVGRPHASTLVALVQTATALPVVLLALPAGVLADVFDRRRLLIASQVFQTLVAGAMALLSAGHLPPAGHLLLTFALGCGAAFSLPAQQAGDHPGAGAAGGPRLRVGFRRHESEPRPGGRPRPGGGHGRETRCERGLRSQRRLLRGLRRRLAAWRRERADGDGTPEPLRAALRAGPRYVPARPGRPSDPARRGTLSHPGQRLVGAPPAGGSSPARARCGRVRPAPRRAGPRRPHRSGGPPAGAGQVERRADAPPGLLRLLSGPGRDRHGPRHRGGRAGFPAGVAWIAVLATPNAAMQLFLPAWVRARGLSVYQIVLLGGMAVASAAWGVVAQSAGLPATFRLAAYCWQRAPSSGGRRRKSGTWTAVPPSTGRSHTWCWSRAPTSDRCWCR